MADRPWKAQERESARLLGTTRQPNNGSHQEDLVSIDDLLPFSIEHKDRDRLPVWLLAALDQARRACRPGQTPLVILVASRRGVKARRLAVMELADWKDWHGPTARDRGA